MIRTTLFIISYSYNGIASLRKKKVEEVKVAGRNDCNRGGGVDLGNNTIPRMC